MNTRLQGSPETPSDGGNFSAIDLLALLWRKRSTVLMTALAVLALAAVYVLMRTTKYKVKSVIEVGLVADAPGGDKSEKGPQLVESTDIVINKVTTAYSDVAAQQIKAKKPELEKVELEADARALRNTSIVVVESIAPVKHIDSYIEHQNAIFAMLNADHDRLFNIVRSALETQREAPRLELERLKDPNSFASDLNPLTSSLTKNQNSLQTIEDERFYGISVKTLDIEIATAEKSLKDLKENEEQARRTLQQKDVFETHVKSQIKSLDSYLESGRASRAKAASAVTASSEAMTMLMLDAELHRSAAERDRLQGALLVDLPLERSSLENQLSANKRQQALQENAIAKSKAERQKLDLDRGQRVTEMKPDIEGIKLRVGEFTTGRNRAIILQEATLKSIDTRMTNMTSTRQLVPPQASDKPAGLSALLVLVSAAIAGLILGALLALGLGILDAVRAKVARDPA